MDFFSLVSNQVRARSASAHPHPPQPVPSTIVHHQQPQHVAAAAPTAPSRPPPPPREEQVAAQQSRGRKAYGNNSFYPAGNSKYLNENKAPLGRKKEKKELENGGSARLPTVDYDIAKKIEKHKTLERLIKKEKEYALAIRLYKKGFTDTNKMNVLMRPQLGVYVGGDDRMNSNSPAARVYAEQGQFKGKEANPLTVAHLNSAARTFSTESQRAAAVTRIQATAPLANPGAAPLGVETNRVFQGAPVEKRLVRDVGAVVQEDDGIMPHDIENEIAFAKSVKGTAAERGIPPSQALAPAAPPRRR